MILQGERCYLRDPLMKDMKEFEEWYQPGQEWLLWDAPWRTFHQVDFTQLKRNLAYQIEMRHNGVLRQRLELCTNEHVHIGWVSWYYINQNKDYLAIGIDIIPPPFRSKGYGKEAYVLFIKYLLASGVPSIFTQTWSGNERMIHLARATCFFEHGRRVQAHLIRSQWFDEITFQLDVPRFYEVYSSYSFSP